MSNLTTKWTPWDGTSDFHHTGGFSSAQIMCYVAPTTPYTVNVVANSVAVPLAGVVNDATSIGVQSTISTVCTYTVGVAGLPLRLTGGSDGLFLVRGIL